VLFGSLMKGGTVKVTVEKKADGQDGLKLDLLADTGDRPRPTPPKEARKPRRRPAKMKAKVKVKPVPEKPVKRSLVPKVPLTQ
jgi:ATP-dependent Clp protease ATP-binding subunit ClpA